MKEIVKSEKTISFLYFIYLQRFYGEYNVYNRVNPETWFDQK